MREFEIVSDGGTPGCLGAKFWRLFLTMVGQGTEIRGQGSEIRVQRSEIRNTLVGVSELPDSKIRFRATQLCGPVKGGALAELRHPARRKGWETTNPSRRNQGE